MKFNKILSQIQEPLNFSDESGERFLSNLAGKPVGSEWELVDTREYNDENSSIQEWVDMVSNKLKLAVITSDPNSASKLDKDVFKVRYGYAERHSSGNSRTFCQQMMSRTSNGVVYRKEDIDQASFQGVNQSHGHKGKPYSLFKYKGGVNCGHYWQENLYKLKTLPNGENVPDKALSSSDQIQPSSTWYTPKPAGLKEAKQAPKDMPRHGHHPNWKG